MQTCHAVTEPISELGYSLPPTPLYTRSESGCEALTPSSPSVLLHIEEEEGSATSSSTRKGTTLQNHGLELEDASKDQPVISPYSMRTDIYLPSFLKRPPVKKQVEVLHQESAKSVNAAQSDGVTDLIHGVDRSKVIRSHEYVNVHSENALSQLQCAQNVTPEKKDFLENSGTELGNDYTLTQSPGEIVSSVFNGDLQQHTFGFHTDLGPMDPSWIQESSQVTIPESSGQERISASRQASMKCSLHGIFCMSEVFFYWCMWTLLS